MALIEELRTVRAEASQLRKGYAIRFRAWESQKEKSERLEKENAELKKENRELTERLDELKKALDHETDVKEKYRGMLFKTSTNEIPDAQKRKRGGQPGQKGISRRKPERIDREKEVWLTTCPQCQSELSPSGQCTERIVEDIFLPFNTIVTKYRIQRQWCSSCHTEVRAVPEGTIEHSPFGLNTVIWILVQRYRLRLPLQSIVSSLKIQYNLPMSEGALQRCSTTPKPSLARNMKSSSKKSAKTRSNMPMKPAGGYRVKMPGAGCFLLRSPSCTPLKKLGGKVFPKRSWEHLRQAS